MDEEGEEFEDFDGFDFPEPEPAYGPPPPEILEPEETWPW
jgi:hypothetical protein